MITGVTEAKFLRTLRWVIITVVIIVNSSLLSGLRKEIFIGRSAPILITMLTLYAIGVP